MANDIKAAGAESLAWDVTDPAKSLQALRAYVEQEAQSAATWYWEAKKAKKKPSQTIQFLALVLTAAAGLTPIVILVVKNSGVRRLEGFDSGPVASLLVGLAAALLGLDKAFGYSSGWTRYVLTATSLAKLLQEYRLDWIALYAGCSERPTPEQQTALIQRAKEFISGIQALLLQETKDWATEFQSNMSQMERDVKSQLDALKAQVDKVSKEREDAGRPGAIELTVTNADKTEGCHFDVVLEGKPGRFTATVANSKVWTRVNTPPGQYALAINAVAKGSPVATSTIVDVKPGDTTKPSVTLPIS